MNTLMKKYDHAVIGMWIKEDKMKEIKWLTIRLPSEQLEILENYVEKLNADKWPKMGVSTWARDVLLNEVKKNDTK